jgi:hypothetical protein
VAHGIGIEAADVDAARDDAHALGRATVLGAHVLADEVGDRDDPRAAGHDRVVATLEGVLVVVGAMEGGD